MAFIDPDEAQQATSFVDPDEAVKGETPSVGGVALDLLKQPLYAMRGMNIAARQAMGDIFGSERMQKSAQDEAKEMAYQQKAYSPEFESETAQGLYSGAQSLARQAPAIGLGIATGGAAAPLGILGADTAGGAYTKYRGRGATPGTAAVAALGEGGVEIGTEMLPMGFLVKKFGKVGLGQFLTGMLAREIPSEQVATIVQDAIDTAVANPDKTWGDYLKERPGAAYQTLLATVSQAGLMAGASKVASKVMPQPKTADDVKGNLDTIDLKNADHEEALKRDSQTTIFVDPDGIASDTLGTKITEDPAVTEYARAQVQDQLGETPPKKFSYWEPNQQELFDPISGPHYPDKKSAGQLSLDLKTPPEGLPPDEGGGGAAGREAQGQMIWHDHLAKAARAKGDEAQAMFHEQKRDQAKALFENLSKEYQEKPITEGDANRPPYGEPMTAERRAFLAWEAEQTVAQKRAKLEALLSRDEGSINWGREWEGDTRVRSFKDAKAEISFLEERAKAARELSNKDIAEGDANRVEQQSTPEFKNWFRNSVTKTREGLARIFYHGTKTPGDNLEGEGFRAFRPNARGLIFVSPDSSIASNFSYPRLGDNTNDHYRPHVYPVYVRAENPFQYWKDSAAQSLVDRLFEGIPPGGKLEILGQKFTYDQMMGKIIQGSWAFLEQPQVIKILKELGHDSIYLREGGVENLAVFDPNQIKSATGNDGGFRTDTTEMDRNLPDWLNQIEAAGTFLTEEDYVKAMAKKIARNPEKFTNAQKAEMMANPRKFLKPDIVVKELDLTGPANMNSLWEQIKALKSWNEKTGEFSGIEMFQKLIDDPKYRGYKLVMKYIISHMKKQEASGVPLRFAVDRYDDGTLRELTWDRARGEKGHNYGAAHYDSTNNLIWFAKRGMSPRDMIHEAVHGLTVRFINTNPNHPAVKALKFIYDSVKNDPIFHKSETATPEYGISTLKEFVSEAFSHPRFQNKLLNHTVKGMASTAKNAMTAIAEQVRRILGIPDTKATNTLEEIMLRVDTVAEEQAKWSPQDQDKYAKKFKPVQGLVILPLYVKQMEHQAKLKAALAEQKRKNEWEALRAGLEKMINDSPRANQEMGKLAQSDRTVDAEDAKAGVIGDITGVQHVAKDPVVDEALIKQIEGEKDGSSLWAFTPGALARAITAKSTLVLTGYRLMDNAAKRIAFQTNKIVAPVEKAVVKILQSDKKAEIMHDLFMRELRNKRDYTPDELRQAGVPEDIIMAHLEFRVMMEEVRERQNIALADKGLPPVDRLQSFITSRWSGPWRANIRDADGNIVWQIAEHSRKKANEALEYIMARETGLKADDITYRQGMERSNSVEAGYQEMLKLVDPDDPRTQALESIYKEYILGKTEDVADQEKHFLRKKGVRGYAGDRPWSKEDAKDMFVQQFEYAKNAIKWAEYQKAVDKLKPLLHTPSLQESQKNNIAYLKEYSKNHLGFGTSELFSKLDNAVAKYLGVSPDSLQSGMGAAKTYFYLSRLGLSIPFTITQFVQPAITTPAWHTQLSAEGYWHNPIMTAIMGTVNGTGAAMYHYIKLLGGDTKFVTDLMDGVDKDAVRWMEANGIVEINQLVDIKRDLRPEAIKTLAAPFEFTIKHSETIARSMAFMAFVTHLKQSGRFDLDSAKGRAELFQKAEDMTKISMTDYRPTERAMFFERGGLTGDAAATLHSYQINNLFQMWNFAKEAKNGNPKPLLTMMFMQFLAAGLLGMWFIDDLDDFLDNVKKVLPHEDYMYWKDKSIKNFILQHANDFLAYGLASKIGGTNIHTRMTAADQLPIWPFEPADLTSAKGIGKTVLDTIGNAVPFAGTAGNTLAAPVQAVRNIPERDKWEAAYAGAPAVAQGPMENLPAFNKGPVSKSPQDLNRGTYRRTEEEKTLRNLGLRSNKEQRYKDKDYQNSKIEKEMQRRMQTAHERAVKHFLDGNNKMGVTEAIKYVDLGGEPSTILQSIPKARIREATTELDRRAIEAGSGTKASILKLKRYLDNVGAQ